jgi:hypothetical protein
LLSDRSAATSALILNGWALDRAVRAKDTAITKFGTQYCHAIGAFVKELARIGGHGFRFGKPAMRAGQHGFEDDIFHHLGS